MRPYILIGIAGIAQGGTRRATYLLLPSESEDEVERLGLILLLMMSDDVGRGGFRRWTVDDSVERLN